jgi:hypothetical protein
MKKSVLVIIVILFVLSPVLGQTSTLKPYGLKSGIIEYAYSGDKVGKSTLYFDDYGMKSAMYTEAVEDGEKTKGWVVSYGDYQYIWDPGDPSGGLKMKNPLLTWIASASKGNIESFTESTYAKMGFKKAANESFLGKDCTVMKGNMGKVLTWNGIMMLLDMKVMSVSSHQEATKIQENVNVDGKYFVIPKDVKFSEMPSMF